MKLLYATLLLLLVLPDGLVPAQDSGDTLTVTGLYSDGGSGEYQEILVPCDSREVWDVATTGTAFAALAQAYASAEARGQLTKYGELFVEVRGRYTAYGEERIHTHGIFEVTELVRHSTATADITDCGSECEDIYGADSPTCLAQIDGQCGSARDSCAAGLHFDDDVSPGTVDTATHYHWECLGLSWGDNVFCTAPKASLRGHVDVVSRLHSRPLTLYGWAYNTVAPTTTIPVEIYVGGARGTGTLAATVTADQPRADVSRSLGITGDHGFAWVIPAQYQSSAQEFYAYALDQTPNPTVRTRLPNSPLALLAPGAADYCTRHGPCIVNQGDCNSNDECQSGLQCVANAGASHGFAATVGVCEDGGGSDFCSAARPCRAGLGDCDADTECRSGLRCVEAVGPSYGYAAGVAVCEATLGADDYCLTTRPCSAGQGDCDNDAECQNGLTCVPDAGAGYGFGADVGVCIAVASVTQSVYRGTNTLPATPSGGTSMEQHVPSGWSTSQPAVTATEGVYRSRRTVTRRGGTFHSATAWETPTQVTLPLGTFRGHVDVVSRLHGRPLTLYGWAYDAVASTATIPVEIYVGGARGTGTLAATVRADQPRADVNRTLGITGNRGFEWIVPPEYQNGAQAFYAYAVDRTPDPRARQLLTPAPLMLRAVGAADYCAQHGPCGPNQGGCASEAECRNSIQCTANAGARHGFAAEVGVCEPGGTAVGTSAAETYRHTLGDGSYRIEDHDNRRAAVDRLELVGITVADVTGSVEGNDLLLTLPNGETITIVRQLSSSGHYGLEAITFGDGTERDRLGLMKLGGRVVGTPVAETYRHTLGDGSYSIEDHDNRRAAVDRLELVGINVADVTGSHVGDDLLLTFTNGETITLTDQLNSNGQYGLEAVVFGDGTEWNRQALMNALLVGGDGDDNIVGFSHGNDTIRGGAGNDTLSGEGGNDTLYGEGDNDVLYGGLGDDALHGGEGDDILHGSLGFDSFDGGTGMDTVDFSYATVAANFDLNAGTMVVAIANGHTETLVSIERVVGTRGANTITGTAGGNRLHGHDGNDSLIGAGGADTLLGGRGADTFIFRADDGADTIEDFEDGTDTIRFEIEGLEFSALSITDDNGVAVIGYDTDDVIRLTDTRASDLTESDFVFASAGSPQ